MTTPSNKTDKTVAFLVAKEGIERVELTEPWKAVTDSGARAVLLSPESGWDRTTDAPPPPLPDEVVQLTRSRYVEAYETLTGERF